MLEHQLRHQNLRKNHVIYHTDTGRSRMGRVSPTAVGLAVVRQSATDQSGPWTAGPMLPPTSIVVFAST